MPLRRTSLLAPPLLLALLLTACTPATGEDTAEAACHDVEHELGTACVPDDPQRVVVLDPLMTLPTLIELDVPVVGAASIYPDGAVFPDYLDPADLEGIEVVGGMLDPSPEAIAALDPDLIILDATNGASSFDRMQSIAPTVAVPYAFYNDAWLDDVRFLAGVVGKSAEIDSGIAAYETRAAEVASSLGTRGGDLTLTRVDVYEGSPLYYRSGCTWFGTVLTDAGVTQPASQQPDDCTMFDYSTVVVPLSLEELSVVDSATIVGYQQKTDGVSADASPFTALEGNELWQALPAVRTGSVHVMGDAWGLGVSLTAAHVILDDLETTVFPV